MNKWQSLNAFWNSFGIPAYDENSVPDNAQMPYITYSAMIAPMGVRTAINASVWYYGTDWRDVSLKVDEISNSLNSYVLIELENDEYLMLSKGEASIFAQRIADETSDNVRRAYITIAGEYLAR